MRPLRMKLSTPIMIRMYKTTGTGEALQLHVTLQPAMPKKAIV